MSADTERAIAFMLKEVAKADPWVRAYAMEGLVRNDCSPTEVFAAFNATPLERERVTEMLAGPSVYQEGA